MLSYNHHSNRIEVLTPCSYRDFYKELLDKFSKLPVPAGLKFPVSLKTVGKDLYYIVHPGVILVGHPKLHDDPLDSRKQLLVFAHPIFSIRLGHWSVGETTPETLTASTGNTINFSY